jgi:hypothetical protein
VWQVDHEVVGLPLLATHDHQRFAKVALCRTCGMRQRNEHLSLAQCGSTHVILHDGVAARERVLRLQPMEDPLGGVPLFGWFALVFFQNGVDHAYPRPQLGPLRGLFPPVARRNRIAHHLPHGYARQSELPRYRPLTSALHQNCSPYTPIQFH